MLGAQGDAVDTPRLPAGDGPDAFVYAAGRLGSGLTPR
jgi:hypothetical protein